MSSSKNKFTTINAAERLMKSMEVAINNMIDEVKKLVDHGLSLDRLKYFGLEYKFIGEYIFNNISYDEMFQKLNIAINRFSKRQMTFFRRMEKRGINIKWFNSCDIDKAKNYIES